MNLFDEAIEGYDILKLSRWIRSCRRWADNLEGDRLRFFINRWENHVKDIKDKEIYEKSILLSYQVNHYYMRCESEIHNITEQVESIADATILMQFKSGMLSTLDSYIQLINNAFDNDAVFTNLKKVFTYRYQYTIQMVNIPLETIKLVGSSLDEIVLALEKELNNENSEMTLIDYDLLFNDFETYRLEEVQEMKCEWHYGEGKSLKDDDLSIFTMRQVISDVEDQFDIKHTQLYKYFSGHNIKQKDLFMKLIYYFGLNLDLAERLLSVHGFGILSSCYPEDKCYKKALALGISYKSTQELLKNVLSYVETSPT